MGYAILGAVVVLFFLAIYYALWRKPYVRAKLKWPWGFVEFEAGDGKRARLPPADDDSD